MALVVKQFPLEEEYKKNHKITPEDIRKLREWVKTQPHLPGDHITDLDLILTYHCCNRSSEVAKQVLDLNLTLKTLFTSFFKNQIVDDRFLKILSYYCLDKLKMPAYDGSALLYGRLLNYDAKNFVLVEIIRVGLMLLDLIQYEQGTWPGIVVVIDMEGVTLSHLARLDVQSLQQSLYYIQEALLAIIKGIHFLNAPSFMEKLMMILRPFLKKELLNMINMHQVGSKTVGKFLPISALPKQAGGEYKTFEEIRDNTIEKFRNNRDFFVEENKKRVVESKRPGKPKTMSDIFGGVVGSFKKLDID